MLRLIVQTKRKYKSKIDVSRKKEEEAEKYADEKSKGMTDKETEEGSDRNSNKDQDSDVSFQEDTDEEIDATEDEEDWIEYIKRSTKEAEEHMQKHKIPCWIEIHRKLKWRMARRIVSLPEKRWTRRVFDWHPGLGKRIRTRRQVGRPKKKNGKMISMSSLRRTKHEKRQKYDLMNNNSWMMEAKKIQRMESKRRRRVCKDLVASHGSKSPTLARVICLKPSLTGFQA